MQQAGPGLRAGAADIDTQFIIDDGSTAVVGSVEQASPATIATSTTRDGASYLDDAGGRCSPLDILGDEIDEDGGKRFKNYKQGESLGRGAYGEVFKAMVAGRFMAVKKIPLELSCNRSAAEKEIRALKIEINALRRLNHPRIVRYHGCCTQGQEDDKEDDPALLIFLEFMPSGSIKGVLAKFGPYGMGLARKYTGQILEGLEFLHSQKIIHRDVKGANILIDQQGDSKLADFGACREIEALQSTVTGGMKSIQGSVYWMAPEVMKHKAGRRSDVWSLGCTLIEMLTAEPPWPNLRTEKLTVTETLKRIVEGPGAPPLDDPRLGGTSSCRAFCQCVLVRDHTKRPYAKDLLGHRFVCGQGHSATDAAARARPDAGAEARSPGQEAWGAAKQQPAADLLT
jgi:mitogen-activated protein kinase kinase kinase